jgi:hypothetical protein
MTLLAAGWAGNPARAADLAALRKAMLARGMDLPLAGGAANTPSTTRAKAG